MSLRECELPIVLFIPPLTMANELLGVAQLTRQLTALRGALAVRDLRAAVKASIEPAYQRAHSLIPVAPAGTSHRTYKGRLVAYGFGKRSLRVISRAEKSGMAVSAVLGVRKEAFYEVLFVQLGTRKQRAQDWLVRALKEQQGNAQLTLKEELQARVQKAIAATQQGTPT